MPVIRPFADGKTRRLFEDDRRRVFRGLDYERALMLFDALDAALSLQPLRVLQPCGSMRWLATDGADGR